MECQGHIIMINQTKIYIMIILAFMASGCVSSTDMASSLWFREVPTYGQARDLIDEKNYIGLARRILPEKESNIIQNLQYDLWTEIDRNEYENITHASGRQGDVYYILRGVETAPSGSFMIYQDKAGFVLVRFGGVGSTYKPKNTPIVIALPLPPIDIFIVGHNTI